MLSGQVQHLFVVLRAKRRAYSRAICKRTHVSKLVRMDTIELKRVEPATITLLDGEPFRNLLEKALLLRGGVILARIARCNSVFKVEHWLLLLLLRLAWFVGRTRLRSLAAVNRGATGAIVPNAVAFIVRALRRLLQLLHRSVRLVITHC